MTARVPFKFWKAVLTAGAPRQWTGMMFLGWVALQVTLPRISTALM